MKWIDSFQPIRRKYYEPLGENTQTSVPSVERPPQLEQKPLPSHLRYAYLGESSTLPIIISASLTALEEEELLRVLRDHKNSIGWSLADLNRIRPLHVYEPDPIRGWAQTISGSSEETKLDNEGSGKKRGIEVVRCRSDLPHLR